MRTEFLCISVLRVASGPRVKFACCEGALWLCLMIVALPRLFLLPIWTRVVYSADRSEAVVPVLVLLFVALWFVLQGDLFYVLPGVILCF